MNDTTKKVNLTGTNESIYLVQAQEKQHGDSGRIGTEPTLLNDIASVLLVPFSIGCCLFINLLFFMLCVEQGWFKILFLPAVTTYFSIRLSLHLVDWLRDNFFSWK